MLAFIPVAFESINGVHVYNILSSTRGRESPVMIQSRRELDDRSSMTATLGKYMIGTQDMVLKVVKLYATSLQVSITLTYTCILFIYLFTVIYIAHFP